MQVQDGSLLVLYTDGLVEDREKDIQDGLDWLTETFGPGSPQEPLEDLCKKSLREVYSVHTKRDDIAVLIAKLRRIPEDNRMIWDLAPDEISVRQARMLIRDPMKRWGLEDYIPVTELLVSELVTNAVRYASRGEFSTGADIEFRLILEGGLTCEVYDSSPALPRVLQVDRDAENGRGLHVVSQLSQRWGPAAPLPARSCGASSMSPTRSWSRQARCRPAPIPRPSRSSAPFRSTPRPPARCPPLMTPGRCP